jgi:hypothetical protein
VRRHRAAGGAPRAPYLGPRKSAAWAVGVDLVSYAMLIGFVYAYFIMVPSVVPAPARRRRRRCSRWSSAAAAAGRRPGASLWLARRDGWRDTFARLAIGAGRGFFLRLATSGAISSRRYHEGSVYDLAWIVPFFCYLWAVARGAASAADAEPVPAAAVAAAVFSAAPVFLIPADRLRAAARAADRRSGRLGPAAADDPGDGGGLGVLTLRLSVQSGELQRATRVPLLAAAPSRPRT